jgi:hypothetical protein
MLDAHAQRARDLIASIIHNAIIDCEDASDYRALHAYEWIVDLDDWFTRYCQLLNLDPMRIRSRVIDAFGQRCQRAMRDRDAAIIARRQRREVEEAVRKERDRERHRNHQKRYLERRKAAADLASLLQA